MGRRVRAEKPREIARSPNRIRAYCSECPLRTALRTQTGGSRFEQLRFVYEEKTPRNVTRSYRRRKNYLSNRGVDGCTVELSSPGGVCTRIQSPVVSVSGNINLCLKIRNRNSDNQFIYIYSVIIAVMYRPLINKYKKTVGMLTTNENFQLSKPTIFFKTSWNPLRNPSLSKSIRLSRVEENRKYLSRIVGFDVCSWSSRNAPLRSHRRRKRKRCRAFSKWFGRRCGKNNRHRSKRRDRLPCNSRTVVKNRSTSQYSSTETCVDNSCFVVERLKIVVMFERFISR